MTLNICALVLLNLWNKFQKIIKYRNHTFFHALTFAWSVEAVWTLGRQPECSNISQGTRQVLMQWNKHVWSWFLHILPYSKPIRTENTAKTFKLSFFLQWISLNKMVSAVNFRTSLRRHNRTQHFHKQKHWWNDQSGLQRFPYITSCK